MLNFSDGIEAPNCILRDMFGLSEPLYHKKFLENRWLHVSAYENRCGDVFGQQHGIHFSSAVCSRNIQLAYPILGVKFVS